MADFWQHSAKNQKRLPIAEIYHSYTHTLQEIGVTGSNGVVSIVARSSKIAVSAHVQQKCGQKSSFVTRPTKFLWYVLVPTPCPRQRP